MTFQMKLEGMTSLLRVLDQVPVVMRSNIVVPAVTKGIKTVEKAIEPLIPYNNRRAGRKGRHAHYRTSLTSVVRDYPLTYSVVGVVGAESGKAPHSILVEDGSRPRFTNSKPTYRRMATGVRTVIKRGKLVTKIVQQRKSTGSVIKQATIREKHEVAGPWTKRQKKPKFISIARAKPQHYRGVMPAFHPVQRGVAASQGMVQSQLASDIASGITREFTAAKLQRGVT